MTNGTNRTTLTVRQTARAEAFAAKLRAFKSRTLEEIWDFGQELARQKELCGHGAWTPWLKHTGLGERTARRWIEVYERYGRDEVGRFTGLVDALLITHVPGAGRTPRRGRSG